MISSEKQKLQFNETKSFEKNCTHLCRKTHYFGETKSVQFFVQMCTKKKTVTSIHVNATLSPCSNKIYMNFFLKEQFKNYYQQKQLIKSN